MATTINAGRVAMLPRGAWNEETAYTRLDVVTYSGGAWVCMKDATGITPEDGSEYWLLLVEGSGPITLDEWPTEGSENPVKSGGLHTIINAIAPLRVEARWNDEAGLYVVAADQNPSVIRSEAIGKSRPCHLYFSDGLYNGMTLDLVGCFSDDGGWVAAFGGYYDGVCYSVTLRPNGGADMGIIPEPLSILDKQDTLVSGVNIKTVGGVSLLGSGNVDVAMNGISDISVAESSASGGNNVVSITETGGTVTTFNVKNGKDGKDGANGKDGADGVSLGEVGLVQTTGDATDMVMSQAAVTQAVRTMDDYERECMLTCATPLPEGYTEVEWVGNENATAGVPSHLVMNGTDWRIRTRWSVVAVKSSGAGFITNWTNGKSCTGLWADGTSVNNVLLRSGNAYNNNTAKVTIDGTPGVWHDADIRRPVSVVDGKSVTMATDNPADTATMTNMMGVNYKGHLRRTYIWKGETLVAAMIPARDSEGVYGLYDVVRGLWLTPDDGSPLTGGDDFALRGLASAADMAEAVAKHEADMAEAVRVAEDWGAPDYEAENVVLDGKTYIDTGIAPLDGDNDIRVECVVSGITTTTAWAGIWSCIQYESWLDKTNTSGTAGERGFGLRTANATQLHVGEVYFNKQERNTVVVERVRGTARLTVGGQTWDLTPDRFDGSKNPSGRHILLGASKGANGEHVANYCVCTIESIKIWCGQKLTQPHTDATGLSTVPRIAVSEVDGLQGALDGVVSCRSWDFGGTMWIRLSERQVERLNRSDSITVYYSARTSTGYGGHRYLGMFMAANGKTGGYPGGSVSTACDTDALYMTSTHWSLLSIRGVNLAVNNVAMCAVEVNRVEGWAKMWDASTQRLMGEVHNDALKFDRFVNPVTRCFAVTAGGNAQYVANYMLFDEALFTRYGTGYLTQPHAYLLPGQLVNGYALDDRVDGNNGTNSYYGTMKADKTETGTDDALGRWTRFTVNTIKGDDIGGRDQSIASLVKGFVPFDVEQGVVKALPNRGYRSGVAEVYRRNDDGSLGEKLTEEEMAAIGEGQYVFVGWSYGGYQAPYLEQVEAPTVVKVYEWTNRHTGCVFNLVCDNQVGGRFRDQASGERVRMYNSGACTNERWALPCGVEPDGIWTSSDTAAIYQGKMRVTDGVVYIAVWNGTAYVWKQISNA